MLQINEKYTNLIKRTTPKQSLIWFWQLTCECAQQSHSCSRVGIIQAQWTQIITNTPNDTLSQSFFVSQLQRFKHSWIKLLSVKTCIILYTSFTSLLNFSQWVKFICHLVYSLPLTCFLHSMIALKLPVNWAEVSMALPLSCDVTLGAVSYHRSFKGVTTAISWTYAWTWSTHRKIWRKN